MVTNSCWMNGESTIFTSKSVKKHQVEILTLKGSCSSQSSSLEGDVALIIAAAFSDTDMHIWS